MPIKFSSLTTKEIASTTKLVGLYSDSTSETGVSNCLVNVADLAKKTELNTLENGAVHKAGSETITGQKTFSNSNTFKSTINLNRSEDGFQTISAKNTNLSIGTAPSTNTGLQIYVQDKDTDGYNNRIGGLFMYYSTTGVCSSVLTAYKPNKTDMTGSSISINYPASGDPYTSAPTPPVGDSSTKIATTGWISDNTKSTSIVHTSGNENIGGVKTFLDNIRMNVNSTDKGIIEKDTGIETNNTTPTSSRTRYLRAVANDDSIIGDIRFTCTNSGKTTTSLLARRTINGTAKNCQIQCNVDSDGSTYTYAPTPPTIDDSTKIATTAWVNSAVIPDYDSPVDITISNNTEYTYKAPANGTLHATLYGKDTYLTIKYGSTILVSNATDLDNHYITGWCIVKKGKSYKIYCHADSNYSCITKFYPFTSFQV